MSRRVGAWSLTLALIALAVMPPCADSLCCARADETSVHAQMACCEASISAGDLQLQPLKVEDRQSCLSGQAGLPVLHQVAEVARVSATLPPPVPHHQPPLFLLNAQFLI